MAVAREDVGDGRADDLPGHVVGAAQLPLVLQLDLTRDRGQRGVDVGDAGDRLGVARDQRPALRVRDDILEARDGQALAHAGPLVHLLVLPRLDGHLLDHLPHVVGQLDGHAGAVAIRPCLLRRDGERMVPPRGVVRADLGADAVLERRDDLAARGVVLGIGREDHQHVEGKPHRVAFDLDVALLEDVEEAHLDLARQVGKLVDREHAPIRPRQQTEVHRQLARELEAVLRRLDRIDVADHVGDRHVGRGQLLDEPRFTREPRDRCRVALARHPLAAGRADRRERIVVDLAARDHRDRVVEQVGQAAQDPALRLARAGPAG